MMSDGFVTEILPLDPGRPDPRTIDKAAELLKKGEVIALPTDTVYGIAAGVFHRRAVERIYKIKERPEGMPLPVLIADPEDISKLTKTVPKVARTVVDKFWPGPLTLILDKSAEVPEVVTAGSPSVGVRCPNSEIARSLIRAARMPLATTSANISGREPPTDAAGVVTQLGGEIPLVLDGGPSPIGIASTVIDMTVEPPKILREGSITRQELAKHINLSSRR